MKKAIVIFLFILLLPIWIPMLLVSLSWDFAKGIHSFIEVFVTKA